VDTEDAEVITIKIFGHYKTHYTVVPAHNADDIKLRPLLISERKIMPSDRIP
jgi:hypothetical protein